MIIICFPICEVIDFEVTLLAYFRRLKWLVLKVALYFKIFAMLNLIKPKVWLTLYWQAFARFNKLFFLHSVKLSVKWEMFFQLSMPNNVIFWFLTSVSTWYDVEENYKKVNSFLSSVKSKRRQYSFSSLCCIWDITNIIMKQERREVSLKWSSA